LNVAELEVAYFGRAFTTTTKQGAYLDPIFVSDTSIALSGLVCIPKTKWLHPGTREKRLYLHSGN